MQGTTGTDAAVAAIPDPVTRRAVQREIAALYESVDARTVELCGPKYSRRAPGEPYRWGTREVVINLFHADYVVNLQRVRQGHDEIPFTYLLEDYRPTDRIGNMVAELIRSGVTMPRLARAVKSVTGTDPAGVSPSSGSRAWREQCRADLLTINSREFHGQRIAVVMLDASRKEGQSIIAALGVTATGDKLALGVLVAAEETAEDVRTLLDDLVTRGVSNDGSVLIIADGGLGIRAAVGDVMPRSPFLRCNEHKIRKFTEHLPRRIRREIRRRAWSAYNIASKHGARAAIERLAGEYAQTFPEAAASLLLDLDDSLTLHAIKAPKGLRRALRTSNAIESMFASMDALTRRVTRWRTEPANDMLICWHAAGLLEAERSMAPFPGMEHLPELVEILDARAQRFLRFDQDQDPRPSSQPDPQSAEDHDQDQRQRPTCTPVRQPQDARSMRGPVGTRRTRHEHRPCASGRRRSHGSRTHARRHDSARPRQ